MSNNVASMELPGPLNCEFGHYPWDDWQQTALRTGVSEDLASLGRATMREAYQHNWDGALKKVCGWNDGGRKMLLLALLFPDRAKQTWSRLLNSDGGYLRYDRKSRTWVCP